MRFWISPKSDVPVREQLVTQILLAISSKEVAAGAKLPSTRALGRQLGIHPNTVSAAYRELASRGWVEQRRGSGVYVAPLNRRPALEGELALDQIINRFIREARASGFSLSEIRARAKRWLALQPPDHFLVVEDDEELRRILIREIRSSCRLDVRGASQHDCRDAGVLVGAQPVALYGRCPELTALLPGDVGCLWLQVRSVRAELAKRIKPLPEDASILVASRWPEFLERGRTMLLAAGIDPDALGFLDARRRGWDKAVGVGDFVIADALTWESLARRHPPRGVAFTLLAPEAIRDLSAFETGLSAPGLETPRRESPPPE